MRAHFCITCMLLTAEQSQRRSWQHPARHVLPACGGWQTVSHMSNLGQGQLLLAMQGTNECAPLELRMLQADHQDLQDEPSLSVMMLGEQLGSVVVAHHDRTAGEAQSAGRRRWPTDGSAWRCFTDGPTGWGSSAVKHTLAVTAALTRRSPRAPHIPHDFVPHWKSMTWWPPFSQARSGMH